MLSADDKIAIQELILREYRAIDRHDPTGKGSFFLEDGVQKVYGHVRRGRKDIVDATAAHMATGAEDGARHIITNFVVDETPGGAEISGMVVKFRIDRKPVEIAGYADLRADVVHAQGKWMIKQLDLEITGSAHVAAR
jgi:uncharacterized protein (TIGR02246 family)